MMLMSVISFNKRGGSLAAYCFQTDVGVGNKPACQVFRGGRKCQISAIRTIGFS